MKESIWSIVDEFAKPVSVENIHLVDEPLEQPEGLDKTITANWNAQLREKKRGLKQKTEIRPYHENEELNALYDGDKCIMWPGPVVSLKRVEKEGEDVNLVVGQTYFPFIAALKDEEIQAVYHEQGIEIPRPSLAICTFALTLDNTLALTIRGSETNMYPGRLYGQGGNPTSTGADIGEHQSNEMYDETIINQNDYDLSAMVFGGVIQDNEQLPMKTDLVGWVPVSLTSDEIKERVESRPYDERPNDAKNVMFIPATESGLLYHLREKLAPRSFCPPARGGLALYGKLKFGEHWAKAFER